VIRLPAIDPPPEQFSNGEKSAKQKETRKEGSPAEEAQAAAR
jgi:hypothetical protein